MYDTLRIQGKLQRMEKSLDGCKTQAGCEMLTRWIQQWQLTLFLVEQGHIN